jgi:hypothetical protein
MPKATRNLERVLRPALDRVVETRYAPAEALVYRMRAERPWATTDEIVDVIVRRYSRELAAVAALTGGAAAIPGAGTGTALATGGIDLAYSMTKLGEMILAIGVAYGHTPHSIEERRTFVLEVLAMANGVATGIEGVAGRLGAKGGASLVARIPDEALLGINKRLGAKVLAKFAAEQGAVRLGKIIPFGIGAGIGAAGNTLLTRSVARQARTFFANAENEAVQAIEIFEVEPPIAELPEVAPPAPTSTSR